MCEGRGSNSSVRGHLGPLLISELEPEYVVRISRKCSFPAVESITYDELWTRFKMSSIANTHGYKYSLL